LIVGAALLLASAPVMVGIAALVRARLGRPILFRQVRPGLNGRPFVLYKFRTMTDTPGDDEARLTPFGRWLRGTSLDELPELWNVIRGDMSLIGPRPLLMEYLELYSSEQARRHAVRPGMTGWAQVHGRNDMSWQQKFGLDVWYVDNRTFWLDLKILVMTIRAVLSKEGINKAGYATTERFRGS